MNTKIIKNFSAEVVLPSWDYYFTISLQVGNSVTSKSSTYLCKPRVGKWNLCHSEPSGNF